MESKYSKTNAISKRKLRETQELLANTAITQLEEGIDFNVLENTNVEFGYIYLRYREYHS